MQQFAYDSRRWILEVTRTVAGIVLSVAIVVGLYLAFYDPMRLEPGGVRAEVISPTRVRIYMTGTKRHEQCPGDWQVIVDGPTGFVTESPRLATGRMEVGQFNSVPREVVLKHPLPGGRYVGRLLITYHCLIDFRHQVSFPIVVPPGPP